VEVKEVRNSLRVGKEGEMLCRLPKDKLLLRIEGRELTFVGSERVRLWQGGLSSRSAPLWSSTLSIGGGLTMRRKVWDIMGSVAATAVVASQGIKV
jgi:hypothetical protein